MIPMLTNRSKLRSILGATTLVAASCLIATAHADPKAAPSAAAPARAFTPLAHVETRGSGAEHVILIPGLGTDWTVFESFMSRNAERYTMHAVTLPGFGGSEPPPLREGSSFEDGAWLANAEKAILALVQEKKLDKPMLVGHWLGGHVAIRLVAHNPGVFKRAVSIDGYPALAMSTPDHGGETTREDRLEIVREFIAPSMEREDLGKQLKSHLRGMVTNPERAEALGAMVGRTPTPTLVRYALEMSASDTTPELKKLTTPLLIIAAIPDDAVVPDEGMREGMRDRWRELLKGLPNTTLVFFENTRLFVTEDAPTELDAAVANFASGKPVTGRARS